MVTRMVRGSVVIVVTVLMMTGCGRPAARESFANLDRLATGPDRRVLPTSRPAVSAALDAAGGLAAWKHCRKIEAGAVVTACAGDGCFYLTERDFVLCPWSDAVQVTAHEPQGRFVWQVVGGQYRASLANPAWDVSPLSGLRRDCADAVLQIATAPVRMLEGGLVLMPRPATVQIGGQWYRPVEVKPGTWGRGSQARRRGKGETGAEPSRSAGPRWTECIYFQDVDSSLVDLIWLGDPAAQKFLLVRGYDYARTADGGVRIPDKIEVFQSDPDANLGPRLALIDLKL